MVERNKDMLTIIIIVFLIILAVIVGISFKLYDYALNPKSSKEGIFNPNNSNDQREEDIWIYNYDKKEYVYINSFPMISLALLRMLFIRATHSI